MTCACECDPKYIDKNHPDILASDLQKYAILNQKKFVSEGPKYREIVNISW